MIRPVTPEDTDSLLALATATGLFDAGELDQLRAMLSAFHDGSGTLGEFWLIDDDSGAVGVVYCAPERMTEGTWNLYLIGVHPDRQREGRGAALLTHVEQKLRSQGERVLLVETMGVSDFEYVRAFYRNAGYHEEARIRDFYRAGQDKIVYWKSLVNGTA
ncbi:MAG: GNAT family N-acetyltransferase [Cyanobacteria bacterium P01_F01_bin.56]